MILKKILALILLYYSSECTLLTKLKNDFSKYKRLKYLLVGFYVYRTTKTIISEIAVKQKKEIPFILMNGIILIWIKNPIEFLYKNIKIMFKKPTYQLLNINNQTVSRKIVYENDYVTVVEACDQTDEQTHLLIMPKIKFNNISAIRKDQFIYIKKMFLAVQDLSYTIPGSSEYTIEIKSTDHFYIHFLGGLKEKSYLDTIPGIMFIKKIFHRIRLPVRYIFNKLYPEEDTFLEIIRKESPAKIFYENDHVMAIQDIYPRDKTHLLIITKEYFKNISSIPEEMFIYIEKMFIAAQDLIAKIPNNNYKLRINNGASANQTIFHIHMHLRAKTVINCASIEQKRSKIN